MKPRLLDLYCGAGGCTRGYQMAGFHVTGVDLVRSSNYCGDDFIQADALEALGDQLGARRSLEAAIRREPKNYEPLLALGTYLAYSWNEPNVGRAVLERAALLSGGDPSVSVILETLPPPNP